MKNHKVLIHYEVVKVRKGLPVSVDNFLRQVATAHRLLKEEVHERIKQPPVSHVARSQAGGCLRIVGGFSEPSCTAFTCETLQPQKCHPKGATWARVAAACLAVKTTRMAASLPWYTNRYELTELQRRSSAAQCQMGVHDEVVVERHREASRSRRGRHLYGYPRHEIRPS